MATWLHQMTTENSTLSLPHPPSHSGATQVAQTHGFYNLNSTSHDLLQIQSSKKITLTSTVGILKGANG